MLRHLKSHLPLIPLTTKSKTSDLLSTYVLKILQSKHQTETQKANLLNSLRTTCGILLYLPPTPLLCSITTYLQSMDSTSLAVNGTWYSQVFKIVQSHLQSRPDDPEGCKKAVKSLLETSFTGFTLGAFILCHQNHPEIKDEILSENINAVIGEALGFYCLQERGLGNGNWVPDSKARGTKVEIHTIEQDPTVVRRRGIRAGEIMYGERENNYWTSWGIVECEFQEHIVYQVFKILEKSERDGVWMERVMTRGLRSDVPMIRKGFLARVMGGRVGVEGVREEWWGKAKKNSKKAKIGTWTMDFVKKGVIPSLDSCGGHLNKVYTLNNKHLDLQVVTREWLSRYFSEVGDVDEFVDGEWGDRMQVATLEDVLAGLSGVEGEVRCDMERIVGIINTLKTCTWTEPRATREKLYEYTAGFLGKVKVRGIKAPEDVLFVLSYFPSFDNYDTGKLDSNGMGEYSPPPTSIPSVRSSPTFRTIFPPSPPPYCAPCT